MRDFTKHRGGRILGRFALRLLGVCALLLVTFMMTRAAWGMYQKFAEAADLSSQAAQNLASLQAQEAQVSVEVKALSSARGEEGQLRQEYGVAKPGEGEIQIVRDISTSSAPASPQENIFMRIFHALLPF